MNARNLRYSLSLLSLIGILLVSAPALSWKMEAGEFTIKNTYDEPRFSTVGYKNQFDFTPAVFAIGTLDGGNPSDMRIRNLTKNDFQLTAVEPPGEDGPHIDMFVQYFAVEPGVHTMPDDTVIEVGFIDLDSNHMQFNFTDLVNTPGYANVSFAHTFTSAPIVLAQIQTMNNLDTSPPTDVVEPWVTTAVNNITTTGVDLALERSEINVGDIVTSERVAYIAIEPIAATTSSFQDINGDSITFQTLLTGDIFRGYADDCETFDFGFTYPDALDVLTLAAKRVRNNPDGGWLRRCEAGDYDERVGFKVDEDRHTAGDGDAERSIPAAAVPEQRESASILVFSDEFKAEFGANGNVEINQAIFPGDDIVVTVTDADGNLDPLTRENLSVSIENLVTNEIAIFNAFEDGTNSSTFVATFPTEFGILAGSDFDITMVVQAGDTIEATYEDEVDATGNRDTTLTSDPMLVISGGTTATLSLSPSSAVPGQNFVISLSDDDLDTSAGVDTFDIELSNQSTGEIELTTLTETGGATGVFSASVLLTFDETAGAQGDGDISGEAGDVIRVDYTDVYTDTGDTQDINDTAAVIGGDDGTVFITPSITVGNAATISVTDDDLSGATISVVVENNITGEIETVTLNRVGVTTTYDNTLATSNNLADNGNNTGTMYVLAQQALIVTYSDLLLANGGTEDITDQCSVGGGVLGNIEVTPSVGLPGTITIVVTDADRNTLPEGSGAETISVSGQNVISGEIESTIVLTENFSNPDTFVGSINVSVGGAGTNNDGIFQALANETIRFTYADPLDNAGGSTSTVTDNTQVGAGEDGEVTIAASVTPGEDLIVTVVDSDLNSNASAQETTSVTVENRGPSGAGLLDSLVLTLNEANNDSSSFLGLVPTSFEDLSYEADGILEVQAGDQVFVVYTDSLTDVGPTATRSDSVTIEGGADGTVSFTSVAPKPTQDIDIRVIDTDENNAGPIDAFTVLIENLDTGEAETIAVAEPADGAGFFDGQMATVFGTSAGTSGDFVLVVSQGDTIRVTYTDDLATNGGSFSRTDTVVIQGGDSTDIVLSGLAGSGTEFLPRDSVGVTLSDTDLDLDPAAIDVVTIRVSNLDSTEFENIFSLSETSVNSGVFVGTITTDFRVGAVVNNNGVLGVTVGETLRVSFDDTLTEAGDSATVTVNLVAIQRVSDVSMSIVSTPNPASPGGIVTYTILVSNSGPHDAPDNALSGTFADVLSNIVWTCAAPSTESSCSAAGVGGFSDTVTVATGEALTFTLTSTAQLEATGPFSVSVAAQSAIDVNDTDTSNNSATDDNTLTPRCGDPFVTPDEECDDGDTVNGDGCSSACEVEDGWVCDGSPSLCQFCGNGNIEGSEACDDGNAETGDGCDACVVESGYVCNGIPSVCVLSCGNGVINLGEMCDDANIGGGDGCDATCRIEPGFTCVGAPSVCSQDCGDGSLNPGEECDDGDVNGGDGCSSICRVEPGFGCVGVPSSCDFLCGNSELDDGEECDDGNPLSTDGCSAQCLVEDGYACDESEPSLCSFTCGDATVDATEECDDGARIDFDGCSAICRIEPGYVCAGAPSLCLQTCGNGAVDGLEGCDDGNLQVGDGCSANCEIEDGFNCFVGNPSVCEATCGDSIVAAGEACDSGINADDSDGCTDSCTVVPGYVCVGSPSVCAMSCGDGLLDINEACDDANLLADDGCSPVCTVEDGFLCFGAPSDCVPVCGDANITIPEICDDANVSSGDGCSDTCEVESGYVCIDEPSACRLCGNGLVESGEMCDDGNLSDGDGCATTCTIEPGFVCLGDAPSVCDEVCGNGILNVGELCDDGNLDDADGCSALCAVETGYVCTGLPSVCVQTCGDGVLDAGEACDDSNTDADDGCSESCVIEPGYVCDPAGCRLSCGNSAIDAGETCDDGNFDNADGCSSTCQVETGNSCFNIPSVCTKTCGNAELDAGEACDDANVVAGDGCSSVCQIEPGHGCNGQPSSCAMSCGDGIVDDTETCDDANVVSGDGCSAVCSVESNYTCASEPSTCVGTCGDGIVSADEDCDDGQNGDDTDGCTDGCETPGGFSCGGEPSVCSPGCGDGTILAPEVCDDANNEDGDGCDAICQLEAGVTCAGEPSACFGLCGDAVVATIEGCDDGDNGSDDGCSGLCLIEEGWTCTGDPSVCQNCGNGILEGSEVCDDNNDRDGDGCSQSCFIEPGFVCDELEPSACTTQCGDGILVGAEACDDGNNSDDDGCSAVCEVESGFQCEGGISSCTTQCGDGLVAGSEVCDDGNTNAGDGCDARCDIEDTFICTGEPSVCAIDADVIQSFILSGGGCSCDQSSPVSVLVWMGPLLLWSRRRRKS